jgi:CRP/FNR family transcriptional regulator
MSLTSAIQKDKGRIFLLMERVLFLKNVEMFKNIDTEKLLVIANIAQEVPFAKGEIISRQDEIADTLYIIKSGTLRIIKDKRNKRTVLSIQRKGDCYGMWGLFGKKESRSATAEANEDCILLMIRRSEFRDVLYENPEITYNLLELLGELLRKANNEITLLNTMLSEKFKENLS